MIDYKLIKYKLLENNLTNIELANILDLNPQTVSNWINGKNVSNYEKFLLMLKLLDIEIIDIIK